MKLLETRYQKEKSSLLTELEQNAVEKGLAELRSSFPLGPLSLGTWFLFVKDSQDELKVYQNEQLILTIPSKWLSTRFFECYLDNDRSPSYSLKKDFADKKSSWSSGL